MHYLSQEDLKKLFTEELDAKLKLMSSTWETSLAGVEKKHQELDSSFMDLQERVRYISDMYERLSPWY